MNPARGAEPGGKRALRWGVNGCATLIIAIVVLMVVVASVAYLELSEPESAFPDRLAAAALTAGDGGRITLLALSEVPAESVHLFPPGETTAAAIEACLPVPWDNADLLAGHLTAGMPGGFVVVADGAVVDYGWHLVGGVPLRFADWPCTITAADDGFVVTVDGEMLTLTRALGSETGAN